MLDVHAELRIDSLLAGCDRGAGAPCVELYGTNVLTMTVMVIVPWTELTVL
jgi:hypothetical protein